METTLPEARIENLSAAEQAENEYITLLYNFLLMTSIGFATSLIYMLFAFVKEWVMRRLTCRIKLHSSDDIYKIVLDFLNQSGYLKESLTQLKCQVKPKGFTWWWDRSKEENKKPKIEYLSGPGSHIFTYKGKTIYAYQGQGETLMTGWEKKPTKQEELLLTCSG